MPADRAAIRARLAAATPGPWVDKPFHGMPRICGPKKANGKHDIVALFPIMGDASANQSNAELIAHAPADLAALLDELDAAERERDHLRTLLAVIRDAVLHERGPLAEAGLDGDQINAVLAIIDDAALAAMEKA